MSFRKQCPPGYISRKGYTRKYHSTIKNSGFTVRRKGTVYTVHPTASDVIIPPTCVKSRSVSAQRVRRSKSMGKLRKGDLIKYGYQYRLSDRMRHAALKKAIASYGALSVYHKLDAVTKLSAHTVPDASLIFKKDRNWVYDIYRSHVRE